MYLSEAIDEFLNKLKANNSPYNTLKNYTLWLKRFLDFSTNIKISDINVSIVRKYKLYLSKSELKKVTQNYHLIALRSLLLDLENNHIPSLPSSIVKLQIQEKRQTDVLSIEDIIKIVEAPNTKEKSGIRDRVILELLSCLDLPVAKLIALNRDFQKEWQLSLSASKWMEIYLMSRKDTFTPLLIRYQGKVDPNLGGESMRLTERSVERIVAKYAKKVHLSATPFSLHPTRHQNYDILPRR